MPNQEIHSFTELTTPADDDEYAVVDRDDTTDDTDGTTKRIQASNVISKKIKTTTGPTVLLVGAVADGEFLKRDGSTVIGATPSGGLSQEQVEDIVGAMIVGGTDIDATYDDGAGTVTIDNTGGGETFAGADFDKYRLIGVNARPNSTTTDAYGGAISPFQDTIANTDDADGPFIRRNTGASSGNNAGFTFNNGAFIWIDWLPRMFTKLKTFTDISSTRIWVGCFSGSPVGSDDPAVDAIGFRYSTGASDTTWKAYSNDSSGGGTITDTGITVSTSTVYLFAIVVESTSSVKFYISSNNGATFSLVATHTTNLPSGSMGDYYFVIETLTTVARGLNHSFTNIRMR